jgi:hypothetical protein|tara:strand:+ start:565 stop:672 length:108 start_codon:yes stop_codon:yes gene_type:complete
MKKKLSAKAKKRYLIKLHVYNLKKKNKNENKKEAH